MPYESRLELARLLLADFDATVECIRAQPFQLVAEIDKRSRRHVPDFLLAHWDGAVTIVNVKPREYLEHPKVASVVEWTGHLLRERGWRLEVWSGEDPDVLTNVRFLAGFRRSWLFDRGLLEDAAAAAPGLRIRDVGQALGLGAGSDGVQPALMHLLWTHALTADLTRPLSTNTVLVGASA